MIAIQKIEGQTLCKDHSLPFVSICVTKYCSCQVRLCEKCITEHETENQNSNLMKIQNFQAKVEIQIGIVNKEAQNFSQHENSTVFNSLLETQIKLEKFALNQVNALEDSMRYLNEQSNKVYDEMKDASSRLRAKMDNIELKRKQLPERFFKRVLENNLIEQLITFYSQRGFTNFRDKLDKTLKFRAHIKDFLSDANKYGKKYEEFMKSSSPTVSNEWSMKATITNLLKSKTNSKTDEVNLNQNSRDNNLVPQQNSNQGQRQKRARTIFGKN